MSPPRTGAEAYLSRRLDDSGYREAYDAARQRIAGVDAVINALDARRIAMGMTKAELARRSGMKPEAVRRLFSMDQPNPTLSTLVALAQTLGLEIRAEPLSSHLITAARSAAS